MSSGNTETSILGILKNYYRDGGAINTSYEKHVLWALMTKKRGVPNVTGSQFIHSVVYADSTGDASGDITTANTTNNPTAAQGFQYAQQAGQNTGFQSVQFYTKRFQNLKDFSISTEAMLASEGPRGAFESAVTLQSDLAVRKLGNRQDIFMHGLGTGQLSQIGASTVLASSTLVLANVKDAVKFTPGQELDLCSANTGSAPRAYGTAVHGLYVQTVDKNLGTLTIAVSQAPGAALCNITDATNGIPGAALSDFIFSRTDYNNVIQGIEAWIPYNGPTATLFNNVNRTQGDVQALAGSWMNAQLKSVEDYLIDATIQQEFVAVKQLTHFIFPWGQYGQLMKSGTAREPIVQETDMDVSFDGTEVLTPSGPVVILQSRNCPPNRVYGIDLESFEYTHLADPIKLWDYDGMGGLRQPLDDGMEYRMFSYGNLVCHQPQNNITLQVTPAT
jgi:hypothetical protein